MSLDQSWEQPSGDSLFPGVLADRRVEMIRDGYEALDAAFAVHQEGASVGLVDEVTELDQGDLSSPQSGEGRQSACHRDSRVSMPDQSVEHLVWYWAGQGSGPPHHGKLDRSAIVTTSPFPGHELREGSVEVVAGFWSPLTVGRPVEDDLDGEALGSELLVSSRELHEVLPFDADGLGAESSSSQPEDPLVDEFPARRSLLAVVSDAHGTSWKT